MSDDPLREFVEMTKREMARMLEESSELEMAHRKGRVGDLIRKYNPRHAEKPKDDSQDAGDGSDAADGDATVEGETGA